MKKFVLFDFDGVIADSFALSYDVSRQFNPELNDLSYRKLFEGNIYESLKKLPNWKDDDQSEKYFAEYAPRMKGETRLTPNMDRVIPTLASTYTLAVVSSTPSPAISDFLAHYDLADYFVDIMGKDVHTSKVEKIRMIFEKHDTCADACVFITDTLGDIREASAHGVGAIGCSWGMHNHETLEKGVPFRIVDHPRELPDAVDDYFERPGV